MVKFLSKPLLLASALGMSLVLSACTTTAQECDPKLDPGFLNKMGCIVSGSYSERIEQKQQKIADLKAENARLNQLIRDINAQDAIVRGEQAQRLRELDRINEQLDSLSQQLSKKNALEGDLQQQLSQAKAQVNSMKKTDPNQSLLQKQLEIEKLEATLEALSQSMVE